MKQYFKRQIEESLAYNLGKNLDIEQISLIYMIRKSFKVDSDTKFKYHVERISYKSGNEVQLPNHKFIRMSAETSTIPIFEVIK
jgi:hypothetical protein